MGRVWLISRVADVDGAGGERSVYSGQYATAPRETRGTPHGVQGESLVPPYIRATVSLSLADIARHHIRHHGIKFHSTSTGTWRSLASNICFS